MLPKILHYSTWTAALLLLLGAVGLLVAATPLFGNKALIVRSGSMEPAIQVGDVVVVRPQEAPYEQGEVISYKIPEHNMVVTHRVKEAVPRGESVVYRTKGDANNEADGYEVLPQNILGRQVVVIPFIGKLLAFAKTKLGFLLLVIVPAGAVIIGEGLTIWRELRRKKMPVATPEPATTSVSLSLAADESLPDDIVYPAAWVTRPLRRSLIIDSISRPLLFFLAAAAIMTPGTWALYSDTASSTNNVFTAAANFGGPSPTPTSTPTPTPTPSPSVGPGSIVINEVMWTGAIADGNDEWLELRNMTNSPVDLTDWEIINAGTGSGTPIALSGTIPANGFWLLSRFATTSSSISDSISANQVNSGVSFNNSGEQLTLRDAADVVIDQTPTGSWPAGSLTGGDRKSMARNTTPGDGTVGTNWHTCTDPGCNDTTYWDTEGNNYGTPKADNL